MPSPRKACERMEREIDHQRIDGTSAMTDVAVDASSETRPQKTAAALAALSMSMPSSVNDPDVQSLPREIVDGQPEASTLMTSTPNSSSAAQRPRNLPGRLVAAPGTSGQHRSSGYSASSLGVGTCVNVAVEDPAGEEITLRAPIVGYEVMEQRAKFTVFKILVRKSEQDSWFLFRRYTDFVRVNAKLRHIFPIFRLALPPKRWFGSNFDPNFLEDRQLGLQAFIDNIIGHKDIVLSGPVREFLCLDDPPGPYDNLEESRALCESLDETVYNLRLELAERDRQIVSLSAELETAQEHISQLQNSGGKSKTENVPNSSTPVSGESSTIEGDLHSQAEADQSMSFPQSEIQHSPETSLNKGSISANDTESKASPTPRKGTGHKQGGTRQDDQQTNNIISVT
ncbi:sorting nexin-16-like isoform X2 [Patiria miniata]|uniref:Sorting nexin-16 n=1 Tax=Patiria miniata TaxID=46514 RepID=A0A914B202_PATMI|nr:sorting nexin-16-like isoform X2 [Patiria miniata]